MLKQRVITAIVLLAIVTATLAAPWRWPFDALITVFIALGAWEWARLCGLRGAHEQAARLLGGALGLVLGGAVLAGLHTSAFFSAPLWAAYVLAWLIVTALALRGGVPAWQASAQKAIQKAGQGGHSLDVPRLLIGLLTLIAAWLATLQVFAQGTYYLLTLLALVWVADTGAYIAGRSFGQKWFARKLAPAISPGKSWEGVIGGMLAVLVLAGLCLWADAHVPAHWGKSFYGLALQQWGALALLPLCIALAGVSVMGDLIESLAKRAAGIKDSSHILPGHGGVLDRIDGLLPVLPVGALLLAAP